LYVVSPNIMLDYLETVRTTAIKYPEMIVFVNSADLNPETERYYNDGDEGLIR
jgi:hypothetical protein